MARHRNVRTMNFDEDYEGYYDVYGRSQEEDACISPSTEAQFLYNREKLHSMSSFLSPGVLKEENESNDEEDGDAKATKTDALTVFEPGLTPEDEVRLYECLERMQNVVGDSIPEPTLRKAAIDSGFDADRALDGVLTETEAPKPQRERQERRREYDCVGDLALPAEVAGALSGAAVSEDSNGHGRLADVKTLACSPPPDSELPCLSGIIDFEDVDGCDNVVLGGTPLGPSINLDILLGLAGDTSSKEADSIHSSPPSPSESSGKDSSALLDFAGLCLEDPPDVDLEAVIRVMESSGPRLEALLGLADSKEPDVPGFVEKRDRGPLDSSGGEEGVTSRVLDTWDEELNVLLGLVESDARGASGLADLPETKFDAPLGLNKGGRPVDCNVQTSDMFGGELGSLLNMEGRPSSKAQCSREDSKLLPESSLLGKECDFHQFLTSLCEEGNRQTSAKQSESGRSDFVSFLDALDSVDIRCKDAEQKHPGNGEAKDEGQRTTLDLGKILGLKASGRKEKYSPGGVLKLDSILMGSTASEVSEESGLFANAEGGAPSELSGGETAATLSKEASPFARLLSRFPLDRRKRGSCDVRVWLCGVRTRSRGALPFGFDTPSPDDIVEEHRKRALDSTERKLQASLDKSVEKRALNGEADTLPPPDPALRQTFAPKQARDPGRGTVLKSDTGANLLPPNNEGNNGADSNHSSPSSDDNVKCPVAPPQAVGDATSASKTPKSKVSGKDAQTEYSKERGSAKPLLNLVVIGHVDAGKSTLMGHLLYRLGCVHKKQMHKYEQDSKKLGKASFMYAWVLDETSEERNRGITMDIAQAKFETPGRSIVLLDAPGHKDFIPNMITGAAQADVAILVVDATRGEFETGFEAGGQTREHTLLVRSLGVSQLAVAINKLDNVGWDRGRYEEITAKLRTFLKQAGYRETDFTFVPCSGLVGENLVEPPSDEKFRSWYDGPYLLQVIDGFKPPERPVAKPFRLCVSDVFKGTGSGVSVSGRIEAGTVSNGDKTLLMPAAEQGVVKGVTINDVPVPQAFAGDLVTLVLSGVDVMKVTTGSFLCDPVIPIRVTSRFQARVVVFNVEIPITRGFPVVLHYQSTSEQASIHKLISQLHKTTGEVVRNKPRCLTKNSSGVVEIKVSRPICVELYKEFKELGRVTLRSGGCTVAAGVITAIT